jgi:hypothetical protein
MRSWIWGGALAGLTAVGVSWSVAPPRPTELVLDAACAAPQSRAVAPAGCVAVTDVMDIVQELRAGVPSSDEPPLAPTRAEQPGDIIPAAFLLPAEPDEAAPQPRLALELAPMPRPHVPSFTIGNGMGWGIGQ